MSPGGWTAAPPPSRAKLVRASEHGYRYMHMYTVPGVPAAHAAALSSLHCRAECRHHQQCAIIRIIQRYAHYHDASAQWVPLPR